MHALGEAVELDWGRYVVLALIEPLRGFFHLLTQDCTLRSFALLS